MAFRKARRVLRGRGIMVVNEWNSLEQNPVSNAVADAVAMLFPDNRLRFLERTPFGYQDTAQIADEVAQAGFADLLINTPASPRP